MQADEDLPVAKFLPLWWYGFLALLLLAGLLLACDNPRLPSWMHAFSPKVRPDSWARFIGILLLSIPISHIVVFCSVRGMDVLFGLQGEATIRDLWPATLVGVAEGLLYPLVIMAGFAQFIGIWLAVKVAGQWVRWGTEFPAPSPDHPRLIVRQVIEAKRGRRRFNKFLVGNALRILLGGLTFLVLPAFTFVDAQPALWAA